VPDINRPERGAGLIGFVIGGGKTIEQPVEPKATEKAPKGRKPAS